MKLFKRNIGALLISTSLVSGAWASNVPLKEEEDILHHGPEMIWRAQASRHKQPHKYETNYIPALTEFQNIERTGTFDQKLAFERLKKAHYDSLAISTFLAHEIEEGKKKYGRAAPFFVSFYQRDLIQKQRDLEHQIATYRQEILTSKAMVTENGYRQVSKKNNENYQDQLKDLAEAKKPFFETKMAQTVLNLKTLKEEENSPASKPKGPGILTAEEQKIFEEIQKKYNQEKTIKKVTNESEFIYHLYKFLLDDSRVNEAIKRAFQEKYPILLTDNSLLYNSEPEVAWSPDEKQVFQEVMMELRKGFVEQKRDQWGVWERKSGALTKDGFFKSYKKQILSLCKYHKEPMLSKESVLNLLPVIEKAWETGLVTPEINWAQEYEDLKSPITFSADITPLIKVIEDPVKLTEEDKKHEDEIFQELANWDWYKVPHIQEEIKKKNLARVNHLVSLFIKAKNFIPSNEDIKALLKKEYNSVEWEKKQDLNEIITSVQEKLKTEEKKT